MVKIHCDYLILQKELDNITKWHSHYLLVIFWICPDSATSACQAETTLFSQRGMNGHVFLLLDQRGHIYIHGFSFTLFLVLLQGFVDPF